MIKAAIFDMDGLLIDSEPLWRKSMIKIFSQSDIPFSEEMCIQTMGQRIDKVVEYWRHLYPGKISDGEKTTKDIVQGVIDLVNSEGVARPGVDHILKFVKQKNLKIALASSSQMVLINAVVDKLDIRNHFDELYSAEHEERGKPHPGVYITTSKMLDVLPKDCIAFEDSLNGILSAKSAMMKCVAVPDEGIVGNPKLSIADLELSSLVEFNEDHWEELNRPS